MACLVETRRPIIIASKKSSLCFFLGKSFSKRNIKTIRLNYFIMILYICWQILAKIFPEIIAIFKIII